MKPHLRCDAFYETYNSPHRQQKALATNLSCSHKLALRSIMLPKYKKKKKITLCLYTLYSKADTCSEACRLPLSSVSKLKY